MLVLTLAAAVRCDHQLGIVRMAAGQAFVRIGGRPVLVGRDPIGRPIVGCPNIGVGIKPCTATLSAEQHSGFVRVEGRAVCLDRLVGTTDGTPPATIRYGVRRAGQSFVSIDA